MRDLGDGEAIIYILSDPDDDVLVDPTLYVDQDVTISNADASESVTIKAGEYGYSDDGGTFEYGEEE